MKKFLFIDNFRGFKNTYIPITDVNFLVGQNSTGKTSMLGLLKLMSRPEVLLEGALGDADVNFGHFKDMVSAHAEDQSYFRIGLAEGHPTKALAASGALFSYRERRGLPRLVRLTAIVGGLQISLHLNDRNTLYKSQKLPEGTSLEDMVATIMPNWIRDHEGDGHDYKKLALPKGVPSGAKLPLLWLMSLAAEASSPPQKRKNGSLRFFGPSVSSDVVWIAPIRTKPRRTYDELQIEFSSEGSHTPYLIRRMLQSQSAAKRFQAFIRRVGSASGLFESVRIRRFGQGVTAPFEVDIVLDSKALNLSTVGYGVSQSLPVFVELLARAKGSWFAIQQPEVHLHPRAQAALGDVFFEMATREKKLFLVETHSDFTIDRFRMNYRRKRGRKPDSQILFFERRDKRNTVVALKIGPRGQMASNQPDSYRRFFVREEMRLLGL